MFKEGEIQVLRRFVLCFPRRNATGVHFRVERHVRKANV